MFIQFLIVMTPGAPDWTIYLHVVAGLAILGLAFRDFNGLRATRVPGRVKRIEKPTVELSVPLVILGILLFLYVGRDWVTPLVNVSVFGLILFIHVVNAFAIITQAAAVAIAYDMWEDKEFAKETESGEVPAMPVPTKPSPKP